MVIGARQLNIVATAAFVAVALIMVLPAYFLYAPAKIGDVKPIKVAIEKGDSIRVIARKLNNAGLIRNELLFIAYVKMGGEENGLEAGKYVFSQSMNIPMIVSAIAGGQSEPDDVKITIPEGYNIWEIDKKLTDAGLTPEGDFSSGYYFYEGYLFPDTYHLHNFQFPQRFPASHGNLRREISNFQKEELMKELREKMEENFNNKTRELLKGLSPEKQKETIIIASILEKEAKGEEDMRLVAGIIQKRLELGISLQIDATVIYGACYRGFQLSTSSNQLVRNCDVTFQSPAAEIKIDGPYNTYIRKGLPPAPISNPGFKAIQATLNLQKSDYLYYLSTRDGSQMIYSKTPGEHAANRRKYLGI